MNPVRQVAEKRQYNWHLLRMENVMNYSLSIWEEKETKRYPSIFWFIVCVLIFAVQNITSIRRRPKLFLGVGLPLLKRRSKWETHFKALTALFSFSFFKCEPESILSLNIRIDMLTEPDGFSVHFCCFHPFLACVKESTSSVNKLNRMSIVWVSVKWFDIELSWRAMLKFFGSRFFSLGEEKSILWCFTYKMRRSVGLFEIPS